MSVSSERSCTSRSNGAVHFIKLEVAHEQSAQAVAFINLAQKHHTHLLLSWMQHWSCFTAQMSWVHKHQAADFCMQSADLVSQWASDISDAVRVASSRPSSLLVFINPFGGNGQAARIWQSVSPVFQLTGASQHILHYLWDMLASLDAPCFCFLAYLQAWLWIVS